MGNNQSTLWGFIGGCVAGAFTGGIGTILAGGYYTLGTVATNACIYGLGGGVSTLLNNKSPPTVNISNSGVTISNTPPYSPPGIPGGNQNERITERINEKNSEEEDWRYRVCEQAKQDRLRQEVEEQRRDEQRKDEQIKQENLRLERVKQENLRLERVKQEYLRFERIKQEQIRQEQTRQEQIRLEQIRQEQIRQDQIRQEQIRQEQIRQEQIIQEQIRLRHEQLRKDVSQELKNQQLRQELVRKELQRQDKIKQDFLHKFFMEDETFYQENIGNRLQNLNSKDETFQKIYEDYSTKGNLFIQNIKENTLFKDYISIDKNLEQNVKEFENSFKNHLKEMNNIVHTPLVELRIEKFKEEEKKFIEEKRECYSKIYDNVLKNISEGQISNINARVNLVKTTVNGIVNVVNMVGSSIIDVGENVYNIMEKDKERNEEETKKIGAFVIKNVSIDGVVATTSIVNDIGQANPTGILLTAVTSKLSSINNSYCLPGEVEQMFDTTVGSIALGATLLAGAGISALITGPVAVGAGGLLTVKEGLKTLYHLDNQVKELITKDAKNEDEKQLILQQHEAGLIRACL